MKHSPTVLFLDIGANCLKLVEADTSAPLPLLKNVVCIAYPAELPKQLSLTNPALINFIKGKLTNIQTTQTVMIISHPRTETASLILPAMDEKQLQTSIQWQLKEIISFPLEQAVVDYLVLNNKSADGGEKIELSVAALPRQTAAEYLSLLQSLNLSPRSFVLEPQAAWQAVKHLPETQNKQTVILLNIGAEKTSLAIIKDNKLHLSRTLPFSGNSLSTAICERLTTENGEQLDREQAERLKCKYGIAVSPEDKELAITPQDIFAALRTSLEEFTAQLRRIIEYFNSEHGRAKLAPVSLGILYGGTANLPGLAGYIEKNINCQIIIPAPGKLNLFNITEKNKDTLNQSGPELISCLGASLLKEKAINLLPPEIKERQQLKTQQQRWKKIWAVFLSVLGLIYLFHSIPGWRKNKQLAKLKNQYQELQPWQTKLSQHTALVAELLDRMTLANQLIAGEPFWQDVLKELGRLVPVNIVFTNLNLGQDMTEGGFSLTITGLIHPGDVSPQKDITLFMQQLQQSPYLDKVQLDFSKEKTVTAEEKLLEFSIRCKIKAVYIHSYNSSPERSLGQSILNLYSSPERSLG